MIRYYLNRRTHQTSWNAVTVVLVIKEARLLNIYRHSAGVNNSGRQASKTPIALNDPERHIEARLATDEPLRL